MSLSTFLGMKFTGEHHSTIRFLDITGLDWGTSKRDTISHIARFAPSLEYLRLKITTAVVENLPPSQWLFDDTLFSASGCVSLPNTIKVVLVQQDHEFLFGEGSPLRNECERLVESLKSLEEHDNRFKMLECSDHTLSLYQLVDRLQRQ